MLYICWKYFVILISLISPFQYYYYATFLHLMDDDSVFVFRMIDISYQFIYIIDLILQPFIEFQYPSSGEYERSFKVLIVTYIKGRFLLDFICAIPFYSVFEGFFDFARLFLLTKVIRIYRGVELLNTYVFMSQIKTIINMRL